MKKLTAIVLILAMCLSFSACSKSSSDEASKRTKKDRDSVEDTDEIDEEEEIIDEDTSDKEGSMTAEDYYNILLELGYADLDIESVYTFYSYDDTIRNCELTSAIINYKGGQLKNDENVDYGYCSYYSDSSNISVMCESENGPVAINPDSVCGYSVDTLNSIAVFGDIVYTSTDKAPNVHCSISGNICEFKSEEDAQSVFATMYNNASGIESKNIYGEAIRNIICEESQLLVIETFTWDEEERYFSRYYIHVDGDVLVLANVVISSPIDTSSLTSDSSIDDVLALYEDSASDSTLCFFDREYYYDFCDNMNEFFSAFGKEVG